MSCYVATDEAGAAAVLADAPAGFGLVAFTVRTVRDLGLSIVAKPTQEFPNHVEVVGKKTDSIRNKLSKSCAYVVEPAPLTADSGQKQESP